MRTRSERWWDGPWPWLFYLVFYAMPWLWRTPTYWELVASAVAVLLFLPVYIISYRVTGARLIAAAALILAIGIAVTPVGGWTVFPIYAAASAARLKPARSAVIVVAAIAAVTTINGFAWGMPILWWLPGVLLVIATGGATISREAFYARTQALLATQEEVRRLAGTAERERITRDLRDVVGRTLTLVALKAELAAKLASRDAALLELELDLTIVGRATDGIAALDRVRELAPDILLTDIEMPGLTGIDVARALADAGSATRTVIVTTFARPGYLSRARAAGVRGYLLKDTPVERLAAAIRTVAAGGSVVPAELAAAAWEAGTDPLTQRERDALRLADDGLSNKDIARRLALAPSTVRNYLSDAAAKLGAANRTEASRMAWSDPAPKLKRRQGTAGKDHKDGRSVPSKVAGPGHDRSRASREIPPGQG